MSNLWYNMAMRNVKRKALLVFLIALFAGANFFSCGNFQAKADTAEEIQDHLDDLMKKQKEAEAELAAEQSKLYRNQSQINATQALIKQIKDEITRREEELKNLEDRARLNKTMLAEYIRQLYYANQENDPLISLAMFQGNLSDMVLSFDSTVSIKEKIMDALQAINDAKTKNEQAKEDLSDQQASHQQTLKSQQVQQNQIAGSVQEKQISVAEIQAKISRLRSTLSAFLGKSFSMEDVVDAVKFAEKKTGVRKEFLFAILDKESDLGRFTGGCTYKNSKMDNQNVNNSEYFKDICKSLGYDYKKMKVSCALSYGSGGAMGVAQFMPSTWMKYKDEIANKTGNDPADPWSLKDGIMGMALYLKDKGGDKKSGEHTAAAAYYCGSNLSRTVCQNYANSVISWSKGYDEYF